MPFIPLCMTSWTWRLLRRCGHKIKFCSSNGTRLPVYTCRPLTGPYCFQLAVVLSKATALRQIYSWSSIIPWLTNGCKEQRKLPPITKCAQMIRSIANMSTLRYPSSRMTSPLRSSATRLRICKRKHLCWMTNWTKCSQVVVWRKTPTSKKSCRVLLAEDLTSRCEKSTAARLHSMGKQCRRPNTWERSVRTIYCCSQAPPGQSSGSLGKYGFILDADRL